MNQTTKETRRRSYDAVLPKRAARCRLILETLGNRELTASEITEELVAAGRIPYFNRNYVAPTAHRAEGDRDPHDGRPPQGHPLGRHRGRVGQSGAFRPHGPDGHSLRRQPDRGRADDARIGHLRGEPAWNV